MTTSERTPASAALARLVWMMLGPVALVLTAVAIVRTGNGWLTGADIAYFAVLGAVLLARWGEFRGGSAQTATGEPATREDVRRFLIFTAAGGLLVWVAANLVANHWLAR